MKIVSLVVAATMGGLVAVGVQEYVNRDKVIFKETTSSPVKYTSLNYSGVNEAVNFTAAAELSVHAVVHVKTISIKNASSYYYDPFSWFFGGNNYYEKKYQQPISGSGSGVVISEDGYIVTNNHVINNAEEIEIILNDKRSYKAEVIGQDPTTDIALLKVEESGLPYLMFSNSDHLKVGEWVLAVGNPFNLTSTVTAGIVSAKGRNINILNEKNAIEAFIQTDAAVNPGNSGGALVNINGELVGINSAIASNTGSFAGYSFAVPVNIVRKVVADLKEFGMVQRAFIGVSIRDMDGKTASEASLNNIIGVYVEDVASNGAAEMAGIEAGDVITHVGGVSVNNVPELQEQVSRYRPGDNIVITLLRNGMEYDFDLMLKNQYGDTEMFVKGENYFNEILGAELTELSNEEKEKYGVRYGVKISGLRTGKLKSVGVKDGFVITHVDRSQIHSIAELESLLQNKKGGILLEGIYSGGSKAYYGFGL